MFTSAYDAYFLMTKEAINQRLAARMAEALKAQAGTTHAGQPWRAALKERGTPTMSPDEIRMGTKKEQEKSDPFFHNSFYQFDPKEAIKNQYVAGRAKLQDKDPMPYPGARGIGPNQALGPKYNTQVKVDKPKANQSPWQDSLPLQRAKALSDQHYNRARNIFQDAQDATMMSGRHAGNRNVFKEPPNSVHANNVVGGAGVHPDLAYHGGSNENMQTKWPTHDPIWLSGSPTISHGYAQVAGRSDHIAKYFTTHNLAGLQGDKAVSDHLPWTSHIAVPPTEGAAKANVSPTAAASGTTQTPLEWSSKAITALGRHRGVAAWGGSSVYERVIKNHEAASTEISRLKSLPSGRGFQQVKGDFTPESHPMGHDYNQSMPRVDPNKPMEALSVSNDIAGRRRIADAAIAAAAKGTDATAAVKARRATKTAPAVAEVKAKPAVAPRQLYDPTT